MSQYASIFDFVTLGLMDKATKNVNDATINQFLIKAAGEINTFLRKANYVLPLVGVLGTDETPSTGFPDEIIDANVCIARYRFMVRRGFVPDDHDLNFRQTFDDCMAFMEKVADKDVILDIPVGPATSDTSAARVDTKPKRDWNLVNDEALS